MKRKILIRTLVFLFVFFLSSNLVHAFAYGGDAYSGSMTNVYVKSNVTSWWPNEGPYGLRITIVDVNGNRAAGSVSVDYSNFTNLKGYSHFANKKDKIEYIGTTSLSVSGLTRGNYVYSKPIVVLPKFLSVGANNQIILNYFKNNFDYKKNTPNALELLNQLFKNKPNAYVNDVASSVRCQKLVDLIGNSAYNDKTNCAVTFSNLKSNYSYSLIVEPIGYIAIQKGKYSVAVTATEAALLLGGWKEAGFVRGLTHANLPRSIYITQNYFGGRLLAANNAVVKSTNMLNANQIYGSTGLGVGIFWINDSLTAAPVECNPEVTTKIGACGEDASFKDGDDWSCIKNASKMMDSTLGNATYCKVFCRQEVSTKFPGAAINLKAGTHFVFEPISVSTLKECRADVSLAAWENDYQNATNDMVAKYNAWQELIVKKATWDAGINRTANGPCTTTKETKTDTYDAAGTATCMFNGGVPLQTYLKTLLNYQSWNISSSSFRGDWSYMAVPEEMQINLADRSTYTCILGVNQRGNTGYHFDLTRDVADDYPSGTINAGYKDTHKSNGMSYYGFYNAAYVRITPDFPKYQLPQTSCDGEINQGSTVCSGSGSGTLVCTTNQGKICERRTTTTVNVGSKFNWFYTYNGVRINVANTCAGTTYSTVAAHNAYLAAKAIVDGLESALKSCSDWMMDFKTTPELVLEQTEGINTKFTYNLKVSDKGVDKKLTTEKFCTNGAACSKVVNKYVCSGTSCSNDGANINNGASGWKPYINTNVQQIATENFNYVLPTNTNRYVLKDTGESRTILPPEYAASGAYTDIGYPNLVLGYNADNQNNKGNITIKYKSLGETRTFNGKSINFDTYVPAASKDAKGYMTYSCPYEYDTGLGLNEYDGSGDSGINVVYRPIKLSDPFPAYNGATRDAGFNWRIKDNYIKDYILNNRGVVADAVYSKDPMYVIDFTGANKSKIAAIKAYNLTHGYDDFTLTCEGRDLNNNVDGTKCKSNFLRTTIKSIVTGCGMSNTWNACE